MHSHSIHSNWDIGPCNLFLKASQWYTFCCSTFFNFDAVLLYSPGKMIDDIVFKGNMLIWVVSSGKQWHRWGREHVPKYG